MTLKWNNFGRSIVFLLSSTSIWCLLAEFYGLCSMKTFAIYILLPSTVLLIAIYIQAWRKNETTLKRALVVGSVIGFVAAIAYDLFRVPFVVAHAYQIDSFIPALPLFKVFPRFGAMILGEPLEQTSYSVLTQTVGWIYHFSNAVTFGTMYMAIIGNPHSKSWWWGVVMAVGLEILMLVTPYTGFFRIHIGLTFIVVTLTAHLIFGIVLGKGCKWWSDQWQVPVQYQA